MMTGPPVPTAPARDPSRTSGHRPTTFAVAMLALLGLVAVACSSPDSSRSSAATKPPEGILRLGLVTPGSLDPAQARSQSEVLLVDQLFDGLTAYEAGTLAVKPALAASWQPSPDFKRWEFTLRADAVFGNGRQVTAADVKYTIERHARRGSTSQAVSQIALIGGFQAFNVTGKATDLAGISSPAPNVVRFDLDEPLAALPALLGNPIYGVVPREAVEAIPPAPIFAKQPVGSGPFVLKTRTDAEMNLVPAAGVKTELKGIDVFLAKDSTNAYSDFLRGGVDWAEAPNDQIELVPAARGRDDYHPYAGELFYGFNLKNPKFADRRFREAIVRAVDRDAIIRVVYGASALPAVGLVLQGIPGAQPDPCGDICRYDPPRAKALVKEVFPDRPPPEINIDFDDDPTQRAVAEAVQANLRSVGINANLRPHAFGDYLTFALSGAQELFRLGWIGTYPDPDAFLTPLYLAGVTDNVTGFASPEVDGLLRQGRSDPDGAKRTAAFQQAEKIVMSQVPVVPLAQFQTHAVTGPRVRDLAVSVFGTFDATQVRLDD